MSAAIIPLFYLTTMAATSRGAVQARRPGLDRPALLGIAALSLFVGLALFADRGHLVSNGRAELGALIGCTFLGALPATAYYAVGRALARRPAVLALVWIASLPPVSVYGFFACIAAVGHTTCTPNQYECPL